MTFSRFWTRRVLPLFLSVIFLAGCGYTRQSGLPEWMKTIYVDTTKNKVLLESSFLHIPGIEMKITEAIIRRLNEDGNLRVVNTPEEADAVLTTDLMHLEQGGVDFSVSDSIEEYRMYIMVDAQLRKTATKELIWEEQNFSGDAEYFVEDVRTPAREEAADRAAARLAKNLVDRIVEDW